MAVVYTEHLKIRLRERGFPKNYPSEIYARPEARYKDNITGSYVAVKTLIYGGKLKKLAIFYIDDGLDVKIKTIHVEDNEEIQRRIKKMRYTEL